MSVYSIYNRVAPEISNSDDTIDVRDVIARFEELEAEKAQVREEKGAADVGWDNRDEFNDLRALLEELAGNGGDEEWRDAWYPLTLVRDGYFENFAREEAESLDLIKDDYRWPYTCIDWEQAANELKVDYTTCEFGGATYYYR